MVGKFLPHMVKTMVQTSLPETDFLLAFIW